MTGDKIPISVLIVPKIAPPLQNMLRTSLQQVPHLKSLQLAHAIIENENFEISVLIGADYYWSFVQDHIIRGDGLTAVQSKLGYLLSGPLPAHPHSSNISLFHVSTQSMKEASDFERFWNIESAGTQPTVNNPDEQFLQSYINTSITCQQNGSYSLKFPWKENHPPLPNNYDVCNRRTRSLARRLAQTPNTFKMYSGIISDQLSRGFIERVQPTQPSNGVLYIPHHPVKKDSTTTPIRIVYNCSCRQSKTHPSLNDCLVVGPTFLNDMCSIILRFRLHKYGLSTNIEKAFLHIALDESDRDYTRFLWLSDPTDPESEFNIYRFKTVLFGSVSSPFMLYAALHFHLQKHSSAIAKDIANNLYVDNVLTGCATEAEAVDYYTRARSILDKAKFNLCSWSSNSEKVRQSAQRDNVADENDTIKVLGLLWHTPSDTISLASKITVDQHSITKRTILQNSSAIFDPLGLITPVTIQAKTLLQELWKTNINWDEPLDENFQNKWRKITQEIKEAVDFLIPRQYFPKTTSQFNAQELHVFADASLKAYGAVAYFLQNNVTSLVMSKTRVSPLKSVSLPRLELMAAVLAVRLAKFIISSIKWTCTIHLWSDSQITLHWINSSKKLKPFVNTRVSEIVSTFPASCWQYCPTFDNPADLLTRGITSQQPFNMTGVDFTGALYIREKGGESKAYICLFTCAVTRAVHLEIVTNLTVEEFLQAFRRFSSRKSLPRLMISDNASTYLAAAKELNDLFHSPSLSNALSKKGVTWRFIPKRAPWYGGFWERLIGLTKSSLKKVLERTFATLSTIQTIIVEIEGILNDRPLTYISSDVKDPEPLTPAHLLYGRRIISLPYHSIEEDELDDPFGDESAVTKRAKIQALMLKHFWTRWRLEYLTALTFSR